MAETTIVEESLFMRHFTFSGPCVKRNRETETETEESAVHPCVRLSVCEHDVYLPGHGSLIWAGSALFSFHLLSDSLSESVSDSLSVCLRGKRVLDLGSGCGLTAMAATLALTERLTETERQTESNKDTDTDKYRETETETESRHQADSVCASPAVIIASDLPANIPHLKKMLQLNGLQGKCEAMALDWNNPAQLHDGPPGADYHYPPQTFDVIIGCEVVYHEPILLPLLDTIDYHLKKNNGILYLISARHRHCYLQLFFELQKRNYEIVNIKSLAVPCVSAEGFDDPAKIEAELGKIRQNTEVYEGEKLGTISFTQSEELSVGWFSEGEFLYDLDKLILVTVRRR